MDSLRKQATKFKVQVAKQQQAVIKQLSGTGYESSNVMVFDEMEMQRHQQLEKLYRSTRSGRDFQKEIVKAADALTVIGNQHIETGNKLSDDCCRFAAEQADNDNILAQAAAIYGGARKNVEKEQEELNRVLLTQVAEPLKAMINGTPLEDARHLAQRYSRMRQEAEAHASEVHRRQARVKEAPIPENIAKLQSSEAKTQELKANMAVLGKEAAAALEAVEGQQHRLTFQRLVSMVEGEKNHYLRMASILAEVEAELVSEKQRKEAAPPLAPAHINLPENGSDKILYFVAEAKHPFFAQGENELSLAVGDHVVIRKMSENGWSEGECKGKGGWFPSAYVQRRQSIYV